MDPVKRSMVLSKPAHALRQARNVACHHCFQNPAGEYVSLESVITVGELQNAKKLPFELRETERGKIATRRAVEKRLPLCVVELRFYCEPLNLPKALEKF